MFTCRDSDLSYVIRLQVLSPNMWCYSAIFASVICISYSLLCWSTTPLAINIESVMSPFGLTILLLIIAFHLTAFVAGYFLTGMVFHKTPDVKALQRTLSYETGSSLALSVHNSIGIYETNKFFTFAGMQSSLLALALANRFFQDPLVGVPPAISVSQCLGLKTFVFFFSPIHYWLRWLGTLLQFGEIIVSNLHIALFQAIRTHFVFHPANVFQYAHILTPKR